MHERTVDIFSKAGALGAYEAQFLLSPAHGLGVVVLTASDSVQANTAVLANTLLAEFVPAAEWAARAEAGARYVGVYRPPPDVRLDPSNTNATLALRPGRAGIGVTEFFYNGTDLLEPVLGVPGSSLTALYDLFFATETPLKSTGSGRDVVFRGVVQIGGGGLGNTRPLIFGDQCMYTFGNIDAQRYGGVAADEFVFHVSERAGGGGRNATVTLEVPVLRAGVLEKTSEEA